MVDDGGTSTTTTNPLLSEYNAWRSRTPLLCRALCHGLIFAYLGSWVVDLSDAMVNVPFMTLRRLQVWRLLLSPLVGNSVLLTLVSVVTIGEGVGPSLERSMGSTRLLAFILGSVFFINVGVVAACYSYAVLTGSLESVLYASSGSMWLVLTLIATECLISPSEQPRRLLCLPFDIPKKYFPLALGALWCFLAGGVLEIALALAVAYADHHHGLLKMVESELLRADLWLHPRAGPDWISCQAALGGGAWLNFDQQQQQRTAPSPGNIGSRVNSLVSSVMTRAPPPTPPFPESGGRVLGTTSSSRGPTANPAPSNRSVLLAAAEKRTSAAGPPGGKKGSSSSAAPNNV